MYTTSKILAFACGLAILAGFLGLLLSYLGWMPHLWGLVPAAEDHSARVVQDAVRTFFGWKYFFASVASLTLSLLAMWLKKVDERLSTLLLSWQ
jgi:hypothetical protein